MNKGVYSLVLANDIVEAVDRLAYERNTSRSNLINQILAEYLSCPTPEMRMKNIFDSVEQMIADMGSFQIQLQPSDAMISIRSALRYRYNPSIRYVLELYRECEPTVGELRVTTRTQSRPLIQVLTGFFEFWSDMENRVIGSYFPQGESICRIERGRYIREFLMPGDPAYRTDEAVGNVISEYIGIFDSSLKNYFAGLDDIDTVCSEIEKDYRKYRKHTVII
ncbi:MAG TPA: hypothetical protein VHO71_01385 [Caproiciproducens sp.]|nr:hypothetical protein [Caproiciproducens sp.]